MKSASRRLALWPEDLRGGVCAAPEEAVEALRDLERIPLVVEHRAHGLAATAESFEVTLAEDGEWQFGGITWPADLRPGVFVTVTWQAARNEVVVRTAPLEEPLRVDGVDYFHEYDPRVVTRSYEAGSSNRGKVLHAICRHGRVYPDGSAVLAEAAVAKQAGLGRGVKGTFLLRNAVDQLIREGFLTRVDGSLDKAGYPTYPAVEGQKLTEMLFYAPMVEPAPHPGDDRKEHTVHAFVRKLPPGAHPSERQLQLHEQTAESELEPGYTYVKKHHRGKTVSPAAEPEAESP